MTKDYWGCEIDPATGLARVPDGYFWRVTLTNYGWNVIQLRKKTRFGSKYIGHHPISRKGDVVDARTIAHSAGYTLTHNDQVRIHFEGPAVGNEAFMGDCPPKSVATPSDTGDPS